MPYKEGNYLARLTMPSHERKNSWWLVAFDMTIGELAMIMQMMMYALMMLKCHWCELITHSKPQTQTSQQHIIQHISSKLLTFNPNMYLPWVWNLWHSWRWRACCQQLHNWEVPINSVVSNFPMKAKYWYHLGLCGLCYWYDNQYPNPWIPNAWSSVCECQMSIGLFKSETCVSPVLEVHVAAKWSAIHMCCWAICTWTMWLLCELPLIWFGLLCDLPPYVHEQCGCCVNCHSYGLGCCVICHPYAL